MSDKMRVTVVGASGKMGQQLIRAVQENAQTELTGATERSGHPWVGTDLGVSLGRSPMRPLRPKHARCM